MSFDPGWLQQQFPDVTGMSRIGRGGQKWVYGGKHALEGDVVVKLFHPMTNPERALREVQAAQNVKCPRVPAVLAIGDVDSPLGKVIWVREQWIHGEDLRACVDRGPLDVPALLRLALHTLEALVAAERVRIVHRDVKPDNILVASNGNYWLLDFGLARHLDMDSITATAAQFGVGTPGYTATEQFLNQKADIDARADLFSLGVTLYECATGNNPFRAGAIDWREMQRRIEHQPLPPITRRIDAGNQFRELVLTMTRSRREQRLPTASEALVWIGEICASENVN